MAHHDAFRDKGVADDICAKRLLDGTSADSIVSHLAHRLDKSSFRQTYVSKKLLIAGGGIGGMAAALALHRAGIDVAVYERAPAFTEAGAGMSLWPNATRVLRSLGVLETVLGSGEPVTQFNLHRPDGRLISAIPMTGFSTPALCIHRADLHRALRMQLPEGCLRSSQRLETFAQEPGGVIARFAGGLEASADGLIAADGINSAIRSQIHGPGEPVYRGYCIWRGIAPEIQGAAQGHISETWGPGRRFGILPMGQGRVCWYATRNSAPSQSDAPEGRKSEVLALFRDWHGPIPALIEATSPADIIRNDARDRVPLKRWGVGRVTLLGDAAHPITPNVGQGACMAIEDAACLAKCLLGTSDVASAFRSYEAMRGPRTAYVARQARRIGVIGQWERPWIVKGRNFVTRLVLSRPPDIQLNAIYAYEA
jgi:2-polyprenyl-6-methoxyphenol hydroxylase-like FAD-dependent oxidoreductase